jgi:DGQHR domain-containing protein
VGTDALTVPALVLQAKPLIYVTVLPGRWVFQHSTPVWRIEDPVKGFQRMVRGARAQQIATAVLEQHRTFPNAITLATDRKVFRSENGEITLPGSTKFLVVDGQHRLYAQEYSEFEAAYACVVHMGLSEVQMAQMFLEINENQRRVPSSLRWDLVRLVRPEGQQEAYKLRATEIIYDLATSEESPLYQRIDLTGENTEISLKQGSLAPEITTVIKRDRKRPNFESEDYYSLLQTYFSAIRAVDPDSWGIKNRGFYKARVLRAMLRLLSDLLDDAPGLPLDAASFSFKRFYARLRNIDVSELTKERLITKQGAAGVHQIYLEIRVQVLGEA